MKKLALILLCVTCVCSAQRLRYSRIGSEGLPTKGLIAEYRVDAGLRNVISNSEDLTISPWFNDGTGINRSNQTTTGPLGGSITATQLIFSGTGQYVRQNFSCGTGECLPGNSYLLKLWIKGAAGGEAVTIVLDGNGITDGNTPSTTITATSGGQYYTLPWTILASSVSTVRVMISSGVTATNRTIFASFVQLSKGYTTAPPYIAQPASNWVDSFSTNDTTLSNIAGNGTWTSQGFRYRSSGSTSELIPAAISPSIRTVVYVGTFGGLNDRAIAGANSGSGQRLMMYDRDQRLALNPSGDVYNTPRTISTEPIVSTGAQMVTFVMADPLVGADRIYINSHEVRGYERQNSSTGTYQIGSITGTAISGFTGSGISAAIGSQADGSFFNNPNMVYYTLLYNRAVSPSEVKAIFKEMQRRLLLERNLVLSETSTVTASNPFVVFDGNSITRAYDNAGSSGAMNENLTYAYLSVQGLTSAPNWINLGIDGQTTTNMNRCSPAKWKPVFSSSHSKNVLVLFEVTNDLIYGVGSGTGNGCGTNSGGTAATATQAYNNLVTLAQAGHAQGWKVIVLTPLPRGDQGGTFETARLAVRTSILANSTDFDAIADVGNPAAQNVNGNGATAAGTLGNTASTGTALYVDTIHPTSSGQAIIANYVKAALQSLGVN